MTPVHVTVWDETNGTGAPAVFVHNIFTWGSDKEYGFAAQRPLAAHHRLILVDRRGYGGSPDTDCSDYEVDAEDLIQVIAGGAHLVGHGNGGLAAIIAASKRPDLVRSLALIQPAAFHVAHDHPAIATMLRRVRATDSAGQTPPTLTPEQFLYASTTGIGLPAPQATPRRLRAVATSMRERPVWEAKLHLEPLRTAPWPTLIICGTWEDAPPLYREYVGEPLIACAEALASAVQGRLLRVPGYYPHTQEPNAVNAALSELWRRAG